MQENYFSNKKILITGITGFIGSALSHKMKSLGAQVYGISRSTSDKSNLKANIFNYAAIDEFTREKKIQICFHLGGESLVETGQKDPYKTFRNNIEGTLNILEIGRKNKLEKIIIASTAHVYGKNRVPYFEGYVPRPSRPYETSKACTDLIAQSYADTFMLPVLIPRFVNIYGPADLHFERLIPKTIKSVLLSKSPVMWGGDAIRDYLYIDDAVEAYILLAKIDIFKIGNNRIFNFGTGSRISVKDLMEKIIKISGKKLMIERINEVRTKEIEEQYVSFNKATKLLKWKHKITLNEGLKKTINWYKNHLLI